MNTFTVYQKKQLEALQSYYLEQKQARKESYELTDAIISWFTDGHAEKFREDYLRENANIF